MRKLTIPHAGLAVAVALLGAGAAHAGRGGKSVRFVGVHPVVAEYGGGFCYIEVPHVHVYKPDREVLYRQHDDGYHFVGDPVPYGYEGPKHAFYGHHPIDVDFVVGDGGDHTEFCYLEGPHYHPYGPPPGGHFALKSGVHFYVGDFPRVYVEARPRFAKINAVYRPLRYSRPVLVEAPPPEYHGPVVVEEPTTVVVEPAPTPVVAAGVHAGAGVGFHAGVSIGLPVLEVHAAPVVVHEHHPTVVVHERPHVYKVKHGKHKKYKHRGHGKGKWKWHD